MVLQKLMLVLIATLTLLLPDSVRAHVCICFSESRDATSAVEDCCGKPRCCGSAQSEDEIAMVASDGPCGGCVDLDVERDGTARPLGALDSAPSLDPRLATPLLAAWLLPVRPRASAQIDRILFDPGSYRAAALEKRRSPLLI